MIMSLVTASVHQDGRGQTALKPAPRESTDQGVSRTALANMELRVITLVGHVFVPRVGGAHIATGRAPAGFTVRTV